MKKLSDIDYKILSELIKNSKTSDRSIAKILNVSQPTASRRRAKLEKENLLEYTGIPNLNKFGFEILAFHFILWKAGNVHQTRDELTGEELENARKRMKKNLVPISEHPSIIFTSTGQGLGMSRIIVTVHRKYSDFRI